MLLNAKDDMNCGLKSVMIRTVDTDVDVLTIAHLQGLPNIEQLCIAFGTSNDVRYIPIHDIASDGQRIAVLSCIRRLLRNIIPHQSWKEDLARMARDHRQFYHSVIAMYSKHT